MMPEQPVLVSHGTLVMLGRLSRIYGITYGDVIEMLVMQQLVWEALQEEAAAAVDIPNGTWEKIRDRLRQP